MRLETYLSAYALSNKRFGYWQHRVNGGYCTSKKEIKDELQYIDRMKALIAKLHDRIMRKANRYGYVTIDKKDLELSKMDTDAFYDIARSQLNDSMKNWLIKNWDIKCRRRE